MRGTPRRRAPARRCSYTPAIVSGADLRACGGSRLARAVGAVAAVAAAVLGILLGVGPAGAAEPAVPTSRQPVAPPSTASSGSTAAASIFGDLRAGDVPVVGVRVTVKSGGATIGAATSDSEGRFEVRVPGPATYQVSIDAASIPAGFALVDSSRTELPRFRVYGQNPQRVLFPFVGISSSAPHYDVQSRWERMLNLAVGGVRLGLIIGLCAVGLSLVYGTTGLVNFAHGELVTFGALVAWFLDTSTGGPRIGLLAALPLVIVAGGLLGGALEVGLWRPLVRRRTGNLSRMLVSIGLSIFLRYGYQIVYGGNARAYRQYSAQAPTRIGPIELPVRDYVVMAACALVLVTIALVLERTRLGIAIRAVADERDLAASSGIDTRRVVLAVWMGGAALSALGGMLLGVSETVQWNMGYRLLLTIFAAVVLGGLGSAYGAMAGGLVVGVASEVSTYWLPADFKFAIALGMLILVLLVRPQGILGARERIG